MARPDSVSSREKHNIRNRLKIETMIQITSKEVYSDSGKFVHRLGTESYFKRSTLLPGDTAGNFEEVDEIPEETGTNYNEEVNSMIRQRYSLSEELAILRQRDSKPDEFEAYNEYAEYCKVEVKNRKHETNDTFNDLVDVGL